MVALLMAIGLAPQQAAKVDIEALIGWADAEGVDQRRPAMVAAAGRTCEAASG
jgi:hypothetical protein